MSLSSLTLRPFLCGHVQKSNWLQFSFNAFVYLYWLSEVVNVASLLVFTFWNSVLKIRTRWYTPGFLLLGRQRQEDHHKFRVSLVCTTIKSQSSQEYTIPLSNRQQKYDAYLFLNVFWNILVNLWVWDSHFIG